MSIKKQPINFFEHFKIAFGLIDKDDRLSPKHIALYLAIFRKWNELLFPISFQINRSDFKGKIHIKCNATYAKTLKDLHDFGYINYVITTSNKSMVKVVKYEGPSCQNTTNEEEIPTPSLNKKNSGTENPTALVQKSQHIEDTNTLKEVFLEESSKCSDYSKSDYEIAFGMGDNLNLGERGESLNNQES